MLAPLIGAVRWPWCVGPGIGGSGPWLGLPLLAVVVVVVVGVVGVLGPGVKVGDGTYCHPRFLLLLLLSPHARSDCLLLN